MADDLGQDAVLFDEGLPLFIDHDLEVADTGMLYLKTSLTVTGFDELNILKPLYEVTDFILDNCEGEYHELFAIASELTREADKLRDLAQRIEDSTENVSDLFDAGNDAT